MFLLGSVVIQKTDRGQVQGRGFLKLTRHQGTGVETRLLDLLDVMYELVPNAPSPEFAAPRAGDIYRSVGSPQKAANVMGFRAEVSLVDGLKETLDWMRA
jgi:nucleoside-diphosphate-sugar epimerase